jgi:integrase
VAEVLELPSALPFAQVKAEKVRPTRYRSSFNMSELLADARAELAPFRPQEWKIFLLAAFVGLRRYEIDKLPWTAFRWDEGVIRIQATAHFRAKSHDSEADVHIDRELMEIFRSFHAQPHGEFVIESRAPQAGQSYRCQDEIRSLIGWLRSKGVVSRTPLHTLRKEFGSWVNAHFGLTAAQQMLRHASVETTAAHYVENKERPALGFGHLLKNGRGAA